MTGPSGDARHNSAAASVTMVMRTHRPARRPPSPSGKYDRLQDALARCGEDVLTLPFDELDRLVGGLPWTARRRASWWSNDASDATCKSHVRAWRAAGYIVVQADLRGRVATFRRTT